MVAEVEIDPEGRITLPEEFRAAFHLVPGRRVKLDSSGSCIVIQTRPPGLYEEKGILVYDHGSPLPMGDADWVRQAREERDRQLMTFPETSDAHLDNQ